MAFARVFRSGNGQAVRLPKEFRFKFDEVEIFRRGEDVVLRERRATAVAIFDALASLPGDFMKGGRSDPAPQEREPF